MFDFTDFNGNIFSLPDFPDVFYNYDNFILLRPNTGAGVNNIQLLAFNGNFLKADNSGSTIYYSATDKILKLSTSIGSSSWSNNGTDSTFFTGTIFEIVGCSDILLPFRDILVTRNFNLEIPEIEVEPVVLFTLRPIVQEVDERADILKSTFTEVFSILPVLITVLISFIGIRKGISFLMSRINKC